MTVVRPRPSVVMRPRRLASPGRSSPAWHVLSRAGAGEPRPGRGDAVVQLSELPRDEPLRARPAASGRRVLIVDDESSIRLLCSVNLELAGFEVIEASDGTGALQRAAETTFDLALLDVMLPDMGGFDVARRLRADERTRALPVVFLSARAERGDLRAGFEAGGVDYITKPFDPIGLAGSIDEILLRVERGEAESYRRRRLAELEEEHGV